jgi:hypothetical protein
MRQEDRRSTQGLLRRAEGTTLAAPAAWTVAAALGSLVVEAWIRLAAGEWTPQAASLARYAAACGWLCPAVAVLGAKRPQAAAWQWIVASLWLVLLVPAVQHVVARGGGGVELAPVWRTLVLVLVAVGPLNYLPTRHALAALLFAGGQSALLADALGWQRSSNPQNMVGLGWASLAAAGLAVWFRRGRKPTEGTSPTERWLAFRDAWGSFWALRVMQRLSASAKSGALPYDLDWSGWKSAAGERGVATADAERIHALMDSVLWRFERRNAVAERSA